MKKGIKRMLIIAIVLAITVLFVAPAVISADSSKTIVENAIADGRFTTLVAAVSAAGLVDTLNSPGPFTVFAPTDDAFAKLPAGTIDALLADPAGQLTDILLYHVVAGKVMAADVVNLSSATAVSGRILPIDTADGVKVAGANVIITDIECSNGVIHVIDTVMIPPEAKYQVSDKGSAGFVTRVYNMLLGRNPDVDGLNYFAGGLDTGAWGAAEVVEGVVFSREASDKMAGYSDQMFVECLYKVLGRPADADGVAAWTAMLASGSSRQDVVRAFARSTEFILLAKSYGVTPFTSNLDTIPVTAIKAGTFQTLVAAVGAAGLVDTLSGSGPFTVFAPTDAAFAKLPAGTIDTLLADPSGTLTDILLYHVVAGKVMAADVVNLTSAETVGGNVLSIDTSAGVKVDGANVIVTDIWCSNGVIHVIDTVMIP
jgi:transforming growth factor-beta-induced protein